MIQRSLGKTLNAKLWWCWAVGLLTAFMATNVLVLTEVVALSLSRIWWKSTCIYSEPRERTKKIIHLRFTRLGFTHLLNNTTVVFYTLARITSSIVLHHCLSSGWCFHRLALLFKVGVVGHLLELPLRMMSRVDRAGLKRPGPRVECIELLPNVQSHCGNKSHV